MTKAHKTNAETTESAPEDRLSHALNFANELNESRLWKIRVSYEKRWTKFKRIRQSVLIQMQKPWTHSTGPRTPDGKAISSQNAQTGDFFDRTIFLPALKANARFLEMVSLLIRLKRQNHPAAKGFQARCHAVGAEATAGLLAALALGHTIFLPKSPENPVYLRPI